MRVLRLALAQVNTTVGDLGGNAALVLRGVSAAREAGADIVVFPELTLTGYPPEDLLLRPQFIADNLATLDQIVRHVKKGIAAVVGFVDRRDDVYNAAAFISGGRVVATQHKTYLPNYGVFDENRYFQAGNRSSVVVLNGITIGFNICEDIWFPEGPTRIQSLVGDAEVIINISASPYHRGKLRFREEMLATRAMDNLAVVAYANLVGGQDELVFDGNSLVVDQGGGIVARGRAFEEDLVVVDVDVDAVSRARLHDTRRRRDRRLLERRGVAVDRVVLSSRYRPARRSLVVHGGIPAVPSPLEEVYRALVLGISDYTRKNGFVKAVLGLSGGIDSALTAVLAVDALGADNVVGVFMPSPYTSPESREDAQAVAHRLGIRFHSLPITRAFRAYTSLMAPIFKGRPQDVTEENLQARIRGNLLMALSNKYGWLVLTTGNKSEMSVGYATLYGDMAGGFAAIKDVPKTLVYELARWRNGREADPVIPKRVFARPPTAELRPNQTDQDSLPPYEVLDPIIRGYVEEDQGKADLLAVGFDRRTVEKVMALVDHSEYKRRQSPPGVKITHRALGKDRRMPITNRYRSY
ncbi:MAG: NAD+ synthase [Nitrospirae bacterium]|nr:MAG: NAD+ synthase [Nitrospirota bacterium]